MTTSTVLSETVMLLAVTLAFALILRSFALPTLVGYILAGFVVGPEGLHLLRDGPELELLAEVGIAFLMFYVGLEFSLPVLWQARRAVLGVGSAQVVSVALLAAGAAIAAGFHVSVALVLGGVAAMSSTAVTARLLAERDQLTSPYGRLSVGVLLFQDVATLPFLVLVTTLAEQGAGAERLPRDVAAALGAATLAFVAAAILGRYVLVRAVAHVAKTQSRELFMLSVLLLVLAAAWGAHEVGLSLPLGAFLVGMVLGETRFKAQAEEDLRPFRDVLLGLFFVTVGMRLNPDAMVAGWPLVLAALTVLVPAKRAVVYAILRALRERAPDARRASVILAHGGEFGLLLITLALEGGVLPSGVGQPLLAAIVLSMIAAPFMISSATHRG